MNLKESLKFIRDTIYRYLPAEEYEAFIYGSRADGTAEKWSDIDVGIRGKGKISLINLGLIEEELRESDVPYLVNVADFSRISEEFGKLALKKVIKL